MQPLYSNVVVTPLEVEETKSGLYIAEKKKDDYQLGIVESVGPGKYEFGIFVNPPKEIVKGAKVLFKTFSPLTEINGSEVYILDASEIQLVL